MTEFDWITTKFSTSYDKTAAIQNVQNFAVIE